ncbi:MAG: replication-associated recombination protein A [Candidatus Margulisiibacteriota bacterium]
MSSSTPLAHRIRPASLADYVGQQHLLGEGRPIRRLVDSGKPANVLFWGPPGIGKTTLAQLLNQAWKTQWYPLNATLASVAEVKKVIEEARLAKAMDRQAVLFIDELHRFSKTQQDTLLSVVEDGTIVLMGATTENPRFSVIAGLVSRALIFELKPLSEADLTQIKAQALAAALPNATLTEEAHVGLLAYAAGDARKLCNAIELVGTCFATEPRVSAEDVASVLPDGIRSLDDTTHHDLTSALIKSMRGSDADAALYWLARLLVAGEDPVFIARRMVIFASEDIGNADPAALPLATACMQAAERIGMPEVRINLAQGVTYLATAPKSNAAYLAIDAAIETISRGDIQPVPSALRTPAAQAMSKAGSSKYSSYIYPHDHPYAMVPQAYWNETTRFYHPKAMGFEREIQKRMAWIAKQKGKQ